MNLDDIRVYWTVASGSTHKALRESYADDDVPNPESCMVSHATANNRPWAGPDWFIDSGGYSTLVGRPEYDTTCREYVDDLVAMEAGEDGAIMANDTVSADTPDIQRFALRDWACEDDILRKWGRDVETHQDWTLRDHIATLDAAEDAGLDADPVAVLQGYDIRDYLTCLDRFRDHGLVTDHIGIGSVCRRDAEAEIRHTILRIRDELPDRVTIHGFGVKRSVLQSPDILAGLDTVDTAAWDQRLYMDADTSGYRGPKDPSLGDWPDMREPELPSMNWRNCQVAYRDYRRDVIDETNDLPDPSNLVARGVADFNGGNDATQYVLLKCVCGRVIDLGDPSLSDDGPGCRHCATAALNVWDRRLAAQERLDAPDEVIEPDSPDEQPETADAAITDF